MGNNTFLYKEINFTKNGKKVFQNTKNCYSQMITSLKHSLRVLEEEKIHINTEKTHENDYISDFNFDTNEELLLKIEQDIKDNIKKFENINNEEERKKILKDFQNSKSSISKKIPLELLELELEQSKNAGTVLHNIVYKHKIKNVKVKDKRTIKTLENYIFLKNEMIKLKQKTRKYNNQIIVKEVLLKIPEGQELDLKKEEWNVIIKNFKNEYFKNYDLYCSCIHLDEGTENKSHVHLFLSSYNNEKNDFDINKNTFQYIDTKYNLDLDFNKQEDHKKFMKQFQEDFYIFFNRQLKELNKKERIKFNDYLTTEEIEKRLKINHEDNLTIDQKHTKLINQKLKEKIQEGQSPIKILNIKTQENSHFLSSKTTQKIEIETESKEDIKNIIKSVRNYSNLKFFIEDLEQKNKDKDIKIFSLNQKLNDDYFFFNKKENVLLSKIDELKNDQNEDKNKLKNEHETNKILKNILENIINEEIKNDEIDKKLEKNVFEKLEKIRKQEEENFRKFEKERLESLRFKNKKSIEDIGQIEKK
ncbi:hypothetical protein [Sulfurospirillum sp. UCH001]|uniref:hypothetical protein n=1 Tax=Sulfurospirillum sp. UCH001 TaxID=1581011 RepID=UPI00082FF187|nr:hypothetical protein [Sulfurospirillum sp. UCH001]